MTLAENSKRNLLVVMSFLVCLEFLGAGRHDVVGWGGIVSSVFISI